MIVYKIHHFQKRFEPIVFDFAVCFDQHVDSSQEKYTATSTFSLVGKDNRYYVHGLFPSQRQ